jgi:hypothetical protein
MAGDVTGITNSNTIAKVAGQPISSADYTIWAAANGSALSSGAVPTSPTTLDVALASAVSGVTIVLWPGTYVPGVPLNSDGVTIVGLGAQSTAAASASVRFTGPLTVNGRNTRLVGIQLGAVTDASGAVGAGTTVIEQCAIQGTLTVSDPATTTVHLIGCSFANVTATGTNTGCTVRIRDCPSGGTVTNATTGLLTTIAAGSSFTGITQTAAGTQAIEISGGCYLSAGITRSAGSTVGVLLEHSSMVGAIDATGGAANSVKIVASTFDRAGSTNLAGTENVTTNPTRNSALEYNPTSTIDWAIAPPGFVATALDKLAKGESAYGVRPWFWRDADVTTSVTVGPPPTFTGSVSYLTSGGNVDFAPGVYLGLVAAFFSVGANNTQVYWDLWAGGAPSTTGFAAFPIGLANAADTRTAGVIIYLPVPVSLPFDLRFGRYGGTGSVTIQNAGFLFIRIGNVP